MAEMIDVLDNYGIRTGETLSRAEVHRLGKPHRAVRLYLIDGNRNILLQQRALNADHYPGLFSISALGHVDSGECSGDAVLREASEELGLRLPPSGLKFLFSHRQDAVISESYHDKQFNDVFFCRLDEGFSDVSIATSEVSRTIVVPFSTFSEWVSSKDPRLAPVYERECNDVLFFIAASIGA